MVDEKTAPKTAIKQKRARHASAQASYMERKRAEGKEWLATWVPGAAKECFKQLIKQTNSDENQPSPNYINTVEAAVGDTAPDWAKTNLSLLNLWLISTHNIQIDFGTNQTKNNDKKEKKDKKDKKKKKKK